MKRRFLNLIISTLLLASCGTMYEGSKQQVQDEQSTSIQQTRQAAEAKQQRQLELANRATEILSKRRKEAGEAFSRKLADDEIIVIGRAEFVIDSTEQPVYCSIGFTKTFWGNNRVTAAFDSAGHFCFTMSREDVRLESLSFLRRAYNWGGNHLALIPKDTVKIYYIGDILVQWHLPTNPVNISLGIGNVFGSIPLPNDEKIEIEIKNNPNETVAFFSERYAKGAPISIAILQKRMDK